MHRLAAVVTLAVLGSGGWAYAQPRLTDHTYRLEEGAARPAAMLDDVAWLVGDWVGEAFGDRFEEVWNPASGGSMIGLFKLLDGDSVAFYEILLLIEEQGSLSLRVKHFNADFTAWEEKEEYVEFRLVKLEKDAVHFSGLSFHRLNDDELHGYLAMRRGEELREEKLIYRRRR